MENMQYSFFKHDKAKNLFAETDLWLKSGYHIQAQHPNQRQHFIFIDDSVRENLQMKEYYLDFYEVNLEEGQNDIGEKYYYLDFFKDKNSNFDRGNISLFKSEYISVEFVVVGLFLAHINHLDYAASITDVQKMLHNEYDEFKVGFYRLFANVKDKKILPSDIPLVNKGVENALRKFGEIGWLFFKSDNDKFDIMPSFHRFTNSIYHNEIINFDKIFK